MTKLALVLGMVAVVFVVESTCQVRLIRPTYRPPPQPRQPVIRTAREAGNDPQPLWLYKGDVIRAPSTGEHPILPSIIDDVKIDPNSRYVRSLSTPGRGRVGSNDKRGSGGSRDHDTGATHPGYNRRNARSLGLPDYATTPPSTLSLGLASPSLKRGLDSLFMFNTV